MLPEQTYTRQHTIKPSDRYSILDRSSNWRKVAVSKGNANALLDGTCTERRCLGQRLFEGTSPTNWWPGCSLANDLNQWGSLRDRIRLGAVHFCFHMANGRKGRTMIISKSLRHYAPKVFVEVRNSPRVRRRAISPQHPEDF